jgi:hypothetical protein
VAGDSSDSGLWHRRGSSLAAELLSASVEELCLMKSAYVIVSVS